MEKKNIIRIIISICIVLVVAGIWMIKNLNHNSETPANPVEKQFLLIWSH